MHMERLTEKELFMGAVSYNCRGHEINCNLNCPNEDSCGWLKEALEKLKQYEDLEEQGKLLKLPCAVGDTVYEICEGFIEPCTVEVMFLADYKDRDGNQSYMMEIHYDREDCPRVSTEVYFTDIGKTVFLTQEEAEAALKKMEESK